MLKSNLHPLLLVFVSVIFSQTLLSQVKYGALAVDRNNGFYYGWAYDQNSLTEANSFALNECNKRGGNGTIVLEWSGDGCAAYRTIDGNVGTAYGWGLASTKESADAIAVAECSKRSNGKIASNYVWACNSSKGQPLKEILNSTNEAPNNVAQSKNDYLEFNGMRRVASGDCPGESSAIFSADDESYMVMFSNIPTSGSVSVTDSFYTEGCTSCLAIQLQDISTSTIYVATQGTFSRNGNEISFSISVKEMMQLIDGTGSSMKASGTFSCSE